jgi:putative protease
MAEKAKKEKKEPKVATVIHLYHQIDVAILDVAKPIKVGDTLHFVGNTTDATQTVSSMQIEHEQVEKAPKGKQIGLKLNKGVVVREGDEVFLAEA